MKKKTLLRVLRAAHEPKITQMRLSMQTGIREHRIWQIENGAGHDVTEAEQSAIATALGVKVADILWPHLETAKAQAS